MFAIETNILTKTYQLFPKLMGIFRVLKHYPQTVSKPMWNRLSLPGDASGFHSDALKTQTDPEKQS